MPQKIVYLPRTRKNKAELLIAPYPPEKGYAGVLISMSRGAVWDNEPKGSFDVMNYSR